MSATSHGRSPKAELSRYSRQMLYPRIGETGQKRLQYARATLVGVGALGGVIADALVRAGVGLLRIVDRDFVEIDNLQRQTLFDESDVAEGLPKAEAAARRLRRVNSSVEVEPVVADLNATNVVELCDHGEVILDGTDNLETRFLVNDAAVKLGIPWVYAAVIGAEGRVMPIVPGETPCLRCIWEEPPPPGTLPTCDTAGVLGPAVYVVAGLAAMEAIKVLAGKPEEITRKLLDIDVWTGRVRALDVSSPGGAAACPCCGQRRFDYLEARATGGGVVLCGRDAVHVHPSRRDARVDFAALAVRLPGNARATHNRYLLRFTADACSVTLFSDGRAIIKGTNDPARARAIYAKYVGT